MPPFRDLVKSLMLSNLAYMNQLEEITAVIGYPHVKFICGSLQGQDAQGYILLEGRTAYVIFRGTDNAKDMINDVEAVRLESVSFDDKIKVHRGFHLQYKSIKDELASYLDEHQMQYDEVVFTGHSLGGALATIAVVYYHHQSQSVTSTRPSQLKSIKAQTYGCPRVGDAAFGVYYQSCVSEENHWRVFNEGDPAAKFPSQTQVLNTDIYTHVGGNSLCLVGGVPTTYEVTQTDNNLSVPWDFFRQLDQHHTALYMQRLLQLADPTAVSRLTAPVVSSLAVHNDAATTLGSVSGKVAAELKQGTEQAVEGTAAVADDTATKSTHGADTGAGIDTNIAAPGPPAGGCVVC